MNSPVTGKPMRLVKEPGVKLTFRKEEFEITYHYYLCDESGESFTTDEEDRVNQTQVHNQYREKYGNPFPDEIREIRELYGVSASKMSDILGFGTNGYRLYESGEIPSVANGRLILAIRQPEDFIKQVEASSNILTEKEKQHLLAHSNKLIEQQRGQVWDCIELKYLFTNDLPNQYSGYRKPNLKKLAHVISYFNERMSLYKTKLNKLLFYSDFGYYKKAGYSITGTSYRAIPLGPVPASYDKLLIKLCDDDYLTINQEPINETGNYGDLITSSVTFDASLFEDEEISVLEDVSNKFKDLYSRQMVELSHQEKAWQQNEASKSIISYQKFAFELVNI
jgi:putative zinc finger/helix-turn-helix YgiT family protein